MDMEQALIESFRKEQEKRALEFEVASLIHSVLFLECVGVNKRRFSIDCVSTNC